MKKVLYYICAFVLAACLPACSDNMPKEEKDIRVQSVNLPDTIANGVELEVGDEMSIAGLAVVEPAGATNRAEYYSSSDTGVATVSEDGKIKAVSEGTTVISVFVDEVSASFTLTVIPVRITPLTSLSFSADRIKVFKGQSLDVSVYLSFTPEDAAKDIVLSLESTQIAVIEGYVITANASGEVKLTASSRTNPSLKAETTVGIPTGDYDRTGWGVTASQDVSAWTSAAENNSLAAAVDGDLTSNLCLVRPGKSIYGITNSDANFWFCVNMGQSQKVNFIRFIWNSNEKFCRYYQIDEILGSTDGVEFTSIVKQLSLQGGGGNEDSRESPIIYIPESTYQYYKFVCANPICWTFPVDMGTPCPWTGDNPRGSSSQFSEIYLGCDEYYVAQFVDVNSVSFDAALKQGFTMIKGAQFDLSNKYVIDPKNATDRTVSFSSGTPAVATVTEEGLLSAVAPGTSTITVTASGKSDSFELTVKDADYDRSGWSVTASQDVSAWTSAKEKNSLEAAIDGDLTTNLCLVRPGKTISGISNQDADFWFCINMGKAQKVNRIRFIWNSNEKFCRYYQLDEILGSNDGVEFSSVVKNLSLQGGGGNENFRESPVITIPETTYQYYKFVCSDPICWTFPVDMGTACPWTGDNPRGSSSQFSEIYLGAD